MVIWSKKALLMNKTFRSVNCRHKLNGSFVDFSLRCKKTISTLFAPLLVVVHVESKIKTWLYAENFSLNMSKTEILNVIP